MIDTILKLNAPVDVHASREGLKINKIHSSISPLEFIKLLRQADNKVNPRKAKQNEITKSIYETLESSPELFFYKTKGILLATEDLAILERNRIRLSLDDLDFEGIMDGGHNTLAIANFLADKLFDEKLKTWDECKTFWDEKGNELIAEFEANSEEVGRFSIPIEIIYPSDEPGAVDEYRDYIAEICSARNNNVQLRESAKGNQVGLYDELKKSLGDDFEVIWRSGDQGKIKAEDVIGLAAIPLMFLQERGCLPEGISQLSPISVYSQKSKCINFYNEILKHEEVSEQKNGKHELKNPSVASALNLVGDILRFFDRIYAEFPGLYNRISPGFGRMKIVEEKTKLALFRTRESDYNYPPGFIYPLVTALSELMRFDEETKTVSWEIQPRDLRLDDFNMSQYVEGVKTVNYDPQKVGKGKLFYDQAKDVFDKYLRKHS